MEGNEKRISLLTGGLLGAFTALTVVGLTYLAERLMGLPFVPFDIFDWMARNLPGGLITYVIDTMVILIAALDLGSTSVVGKLVEQSIAILQFILGGTVIGVIAYAGARGICKVEIQVDDGPWEAAELRTPPLSPLSWVQWRYKWQSEPGRHTFRVRAYDGNGDLQATEPTEPHPDGASGIHSVTESVRS